ncbi:MAG: adenylosuccinate synthase [Candidatus Eisenbacteria bacterium]|uniref:Adenylosuccinate synthetase n=1 Tax=Eiseniibacteriota bacterium TaxID=2212470 RepID=A0A7Y2E9R5_UNCEI|nr:adenylosuccinate synthase [Candidatus Eisenbacteria bacterium]
MPVSMILGTQWGDEGKGKIVDLLSDDADVVVRFQGGPNAGHTLVVDGETTVLHLVPSGILHPKTDCVIGNGVVLNLDGLFQELDELKSKGVNTEGRLWISDRAHLILPGHRALEAHEEQGAGAVGTTLRGIGPAYRDKMARIGVTVGEFLNKEAFLTALARQRVWRERLVPSLPEESIDPDQVEAQMGVYRDRLKPMVRDTGLALVQWAKQDRRILLEGAQGTLLDVDHGTYPFVTSSNASAGGACTGSGIPPRMIDRVLGVTKAYTTRVGLGPFPTELGGEEGEKLRAAGGEFGATTGRPRRCGWLDGLALRHAVRINGLDGLIVTKLDVLSGYETIKIATAYQCDGELLTEFPAGIGALEGAEPVYESFPGWSESLDSMRHWDELPQTARNFVARIKEITDVPIHWVSVGQAREATIPGPSLETKVRVGR